MLVRLQWLHDARRGQLRLSEVTILPKESLTSLDLDALDEHLIAFHLKALEELPAEFKRVPQRRPRAGEPPDVSFYRAVLDARSQLIRDGYRNINAELARRMNVSPNTVKSWVRRGQQYLAGKESR